MKKWVWHIGLTAAMGGIIAACTSGDGKTNDVAGSSFETENSVAVVLAVQKSDGTPAARTKVFVRPSDFLAGANNFAISDEYDNLESPVVESDSAAGILNVETDSLGVLNLPRLKPGNYTIEAREELGKGVTRVVVTDSSLDSVSLKMTNPGSISGQVYLPESESSVTVGIEGLDYFVKTDTAGNFEFKNIPVGSFSVVGFVFHTYKSLDLNGDPSTSSVYMSLGTRRTNVSSGTESKNVVIGQKPIVIEKDIDREGLVAHFEYSNDSNYNWALMGRSLGDPMDFSDLDSVVFWARSAKGDSAQWISLSFDVQLDSASLEKYGYENGKAWVHMELDTVWQRYVITPDDLLETDSTKIGGNIGWDAVKDHVTNLNFFGGGVTKGSPYEMWLDDVTIYGVKDLE